MTGPLIARAAHEFLYGSQALGIAMCCHFSHSDCMTQNGCSIYSAALHLYFMCGEGIFFPICGGLRSIHFNHFMPPLM